MPMLYFIRLGSSPECSQNRIIIMAAARVTDLGFSTSSSSVNPKPIQYYDLNGQPISNPEETIYFLNQPVMLMHAELAELKRHTDFTIKSRDKEDELSFRIHYTKPQYEVDYLAWDADAQIGMVELWGRRNTQEDTATFGHLPAFMSLTDEQATELLEYTPATLQKIILLNNLGNYCGSTFCSVIIQGNKVFTTNVGDSTALLCLIDQDGGVSLERLNRKLHEFMLRLSHAIGDQDYGMEHDADVYIDTVTIPENGRAFILNACDGLINNRWMSMGAVREYIKILYHDDNNISALELSKKLATESFNRGSLDNITVIATELNTNETIAKQMNIYDGHGGNQVSLILRQLHEVVLLNELLLIKAFPQHVNLRDSLRNIFRDSQCGKAVNEIRANYLFFNQTFLPLLASQMDSSIPESGINIDEFGSALAVYLTNYFSRDLFHFNQLLDINKGLAPSNLIKTLQQINLLMEITKHILAIRSICFPTMPFSLSPEFMSYQANITDKSIIKAIESALNVALQSYPEKSMTEISDHILKVLTNMHITSSKRTFFLFPTLLTQTLKTTINTVHGIQQQLLALHQLRGDFNQISIN